MLIDFGVSAWPIVLADQGLGYRNTIACSRWQWDGDHGLSKCNFEECHWNCAGNLNLIHGVVQQLTGHWVWGEAVQNFPMPMSIDITNDGYYNCSIPKLLVIWEVRKLYQTLQCLTVSPSLHFLIWVALNPTTKNNVIKHWIQTNCKYHHCHLEIQGVRISGVELWQVQPQKHPQVCMASEKTDTHHFEWCSLLEQGKGLGRGF